MYITFTSLTLGQAWRGDGSSRPHSAIGISSLLLGRFQNLFHTAITIKLVSVSSIDAHSLVLRQEYLEGTHQSFVDTHHGAGIVEFTTIVGSGEDCNQLPLGEKLITIFHDLVRSAD